MRTANAHAVLFADAGRQIADRYVRPSSLASACSSCFHRRNPGAVAVTAVSGGQHWRYCGRCRHSPIRRCWRCHRRHTARRDQVRGSESCRAPVPALAAASDAGSCLSTAAAPMDHPAWPALPTARRSPSNLGNLPNGVEFNRRRTGWPRGQRL